MTMVQKVHLNRQVTIGSKSRHQFIHLIRLGVALVLEARIALLLENVVDASAKIFKKKKKKKKTFVTLEDVLMRAKQQKELDETLAKNSACQSPQEPKKPHELG